MWTDLTKKDEYKSVVGKRKHLCNPKMSWGNGAVMTWTYVSARGTHRTPYICQGLWA